MIAPSARWRRYSRRTCQGATVQALGKPIGTLLIHISPLFPNRLKIAAITDSLILRSEGTAVATSSGSSESSAGSVDSYNGDDARRFCRQLEDMWILYSKSIVLNGQLELHLEAQQVALTAAGEELVIARSRLSEADATVAGMFLFRGLSLAILFLPSFKDSSYSFLPTAMTVQLENLHLAAEEAVGAVNARVETLELRLWDVTTHIREVTLQGVRRGAAASLSAAQARSRFDLHIMEPGFLENKDPESREGAMDDFVAHAEAIH